MENPTTFALVRSPAPIITFPAPASSNAACGFPALRFPACFTSRVMRPIASGVVGQFELSRLLGLFRLIGSPRQALPLLLCGLSGLRCFAKLTHCIGDGVMAGKLRHSKAIFYR